MPDKIKGLGKKIDEIILNGGKVDDPENDILRIDDIKNEGISVDVVELKKALERFKDTSGELYMKKIDAAKSMKDEYNIIGATEFCDNAELNMDSIAKGRPVKNDMDKQSLGRK